MTMPQYKHLVWNRTDLVFGNNSSISYNGAVTPLVNEDFPPENYAGEVIPPYAVMRVVGNPIWHKEEICWMVARPDDQSMSGQYVGMHFFNGSKPIPIKAYGRATNDMPAPVLIDLTLNLRFLPYGNVNPSGQLNAVTGSKGTGFNAGWLMGYVSGDWALHPSIDLINYGSTSWLGVDSGLPGGKVTLSVTQFPYIIIGNHPDGVSGDTAGPTDSPEVEFDYSNQVFWVGRGALGFGSEGFSG